MSSDEFPLDLVSYQKADSQSMELLTKKKQKTYAANFVYTLTKCLDLFQSIHKILSRDIWTEILGG